MPFRFHKFFFQIASINTLIAKKKSWKLEKTQDNFWFKIFVKTK